MYQITCDNQILYDIRAKNRKLISPKLVLEAGKNGNLSFRIPKSNPCYDLINLKKSIFRVFQVDTINNEKIYTQLFRGMAYSQLEDFYSTGTIEVEGELSFFNDSMVRPYNIKATAYDLFYKYVNEHNSRVDSVKQFIPRKCTVTGEVNRYSDSYQTTKYELDEKLINSLGGHFETEEIDEKVYIDYIAEYDKRNTQAIVFKKNLLDFTKHITAQNVKTVIIPLREKS